MISQSFIRQVGPAKWALRYFIRQYKKRILRTGAYVKLPTGLTYYAPPWDPSGSEVYVTGADMDWGSEKLLSQALDKEGIFIDVGAHTGYYSLYMLPLVSWVYAFEPDSQSFDELRNYSGQYANFLSFRYAVSNQSGNMEIQIKGSGYSFIKGSSTESFSPINKKPQSVKVIKLDNYIDEYQSRITGIKIDVDGPDLDVLEGAMQIIAKDHPVVLIELSSKQANRLRHICSQLNYSIFFFLRNKNMSSSTLFELLEKDNRLLNNAKMLFLVPEEKKHVFDCIVQEAND